MKKMLEAALAFIKPDQTFVFNIKDPIEAFVNVYTNATE